MGMRVLSDQQSYNLFCSGKVIGPTFQFNVSDIKFGLVSCGKLRILLDGVVQYLNHFRFCEHS